MAPLRLSRVPSRVQSRVVSRAPSPTPSDDGQPSGGSQSRKDPLLHKSLLEAMAGPHPTSMTKPSMPDPKLDSIAEDIENLGTAIQEGIQALSDRFDANERQVDAWREDVAAKLDQRLHFIVGELLQRRRLAHCRLQQHRE